jgi:hypothetical protein
VADNGCDVEGGAFLAAQRWIRIFPVADRISADYAEYQTSIEALESTWAKLATIRTTLNDRERRVLDELTRRVKADPPQSAEDIAQLGQTIDWMLPKVTTRYAVLVDCDVEFRYPGWLSEIVKLMDRSRIDLLGFVEPTPHPVAERFATFVLAMRTHEICALQRSFATHLEFDDCLEAARWHAQPHGKFLDTTAFDDYPTARFYDTAARVYEAAQRQGLRCAEFPAQWRERFLHLGHMAWSDKIDESYQGWGSLRFQRQQALAYAQSRCNELGIGSLHC